MRKRHDDREGSRGLNRRGAKAYQWAMEAALSIPIGALLGYWADSAFETRPWLLIVGVVLGFGAFVSRLARMRSLVEDDENDPMPPGEP